MIANLLFIICYDPKLVEPISSFESPHFNRQIFAVRVESIKLLLE